MTKKSEVVMGKVQKRGATLSIGRISQTSFEYLMTKAYIWNMFKIVGIQGYKSIRSQKVTLGRMNILIGANGAGKSNFLSVFHLAKVVSEDGLDSWVEEQGGANRILYLGRKNTSEISISFNLEDSVSQPLSAASFSLKEKTDRLSTSLLLSLWNSERNSSEILEKDTQRNIARLFQPLRVYHFVDTGKTSPIKQNCNVNDNRFLRPDGSNLAAVLYYISQKHPKRFAQIEQTIREIAPFFAGFDLQPSRINDSIIRLSWRQKGASDAYLDAEQLSDGTLRMMCLITLLMQPELPEVILIDEPELGLHPAALAMFCALAKKAIKESQIIISTQSIDIVSQFSPEDIIVCDNAGEETVFKRLGDLDLSTWQENYSLGELWEKNVFGGNP